ncbi:nadK [Symbiodinium sp. KB8]|nr:nadK [Symbiodinium sp. KB8]
MKLSVIASNRPASQGAFKAIKEKYNLVSPADADVLVVLGGDGFMLRTLHERINRPTPIFGMNCGKIGFLLNEFNLDNLENRIRQAEQVILKPLEMKTENIHGKVEKTYAINEVSLYRHSSHAAHLKISVDNQERLSELVCDGVLVATPAGSTAYNLSANGPIIPIGSNIMALTPICAFRPRRWKGALLPHNAKVQIEVLDPERRPVAAVSDYLEFSKVKKVEIQEAQQIKLPLLFDPEHNLEKRIISEQFYT